ncbi:hypothetical protein [Mycolicibacterium brumae]|uniref:ABC transporter permease n=1 Tax=Mycolicibacterium brumae TaxID=85968 RepID=A0A2G5PGJ1_9MYCO|nr:hypothetical protein [Mycolicibacterium brumae]MCV7192578.1 ABC transporter permease [Mycolicibacterium brumae]PIB77432.1 ABC transporter permease [Mycolicibacterium brumae]RWA18430.1 hypothetical protein MBRU_04230 [Mycolicibacterium brumae DSM 44177]UWW10348.1 ABC transporter permease [Mycolicibacterium brumae]
MTRALASEWRKLISTRTPLWAAVAVAALSLGVALLLGYTAYPLTPMAPEKAATGVALLGVPALMVLASISVTAEYRSAMIRTTFLATPNRAAVLTAKALVAAVCCAVLAALATLGSVLVARWAAAPRAAAGLDLAHADTWRAVGAVALVAALAAVAAVGVAAVLREAAATVAVLLMWPLVIESVLGTLPSISAHVGPYLPFANGLAFARVPAFTAPFPMAWGELGSLAYFTGFVAVCFAAGLVAISRRDA